ncbi:MAG: hypothetical protein QG650_458 [Patescibacteria group bacterium]|nr:hypothetical protein [Patescibacteria group bacterium]
MRHDPSWAHAGKIPVQGIPLADKFPKPRPGIGLAIPMKPGI